MFPLWKKPYRFADETDLIAYRKWNEDLARGLQRRRRKDGRRNVVETPTIDGVDDIVPLGAGPVSSSDFVAAKRDEDSEADVERGMVGGAVDQVVPQSWRDEMWWEAWRSGFLFRPWQ